jgi:hypothetical protein
LVTETTVTAASIVVEPTVATEEYETEAPEADAAPMSPLGLANTKELPDTSRADAGTWLVRTRTKAESTDTPNRELRVFITQLYCSLILRAQEKLNSGKIDPLG